jgi:hypothetical protein
MFELEGDVFSIFYRALVALGVYILITTASAGRTSDFSLRKGFGPDLRARNIVADNRKIKPKPMIIFGSPRAKQKVSVFVSLRSEQCAGRG